MDVLDNVVQSLHVQDGNTALILATLKGHVAVVQLILQHNADVSICNKVYTIVVESYHIRLPVVRYVLSST